MRRKPALFIAFIGILLTATAVRDARSENTPNAPANNEKSMQAEVIDPAAYLKDGLHGADRVEQTYEAVDGGQTLALLEEGTGALYLLVAEQPGEDPNELVYDYANQVVKVKGRVVERGGLRGIVLSSAEPVAATGANPSAAAPTAKANPAAVPED